MLRVFGCMCMALVPKHLRHNKLGAKAIWAVHLGMAQNSKGWLLWDPFTKKFLVSRDCKFMENLMYKDWKAENEAKIGMRFGEVKSSGFEHVELPLELSSGSTTTRQSSLVNGGEEAKDAEEEEEEVQQVSERAPTLPSRTTSAPRIQVTPQQRQGLHVPAAEEEGRGKRRIQAPNRLTYDALGKPAKSALAGAALMVGEDEESDYEECAFAFFSPVEMPGEPATLKEALESSDAEEWKKAMERFDHEGRPLQFDTWLDDLQLYLLSDSRDSVLLFDHTSGAAPAPPATVAGTTRSQTAQALYDTNVARYSSPATTALGRLLLPYLFPELSAFATLEDQVSHLRTSNARYRAAAPAEFLDRNQTPMFITLYFIVTRLPDSLRSVRDQLLSLDPTVLTIELLEQHILAAETSVVTVGAARGTPRTTFFEGCSPSPFVPSYASAAAVNVPSAEDVGAASASAKRRNSKGKGGRGGGGGSRSGGGGSSGGGGGSGGGGSSGGGGGSGGFTGGGGGSGGSGGSGRGGSGGGRTKAQRGGFGGGQRQRQQCRSKTLVPQQLREWLFQRGASGGSVSCPYDIRTGDRAGQTKGKHHTQHRCFSHLDDAWRAEFGDEVKRPHRAELLRSGFAVIDLDYDAILFAMYALSASAEGDCYLCVPPDPGIEAAALGASESSLSGSAPAEALHTFTQDSRASRCFFRDRTTLTPLPAPVPVRLANPSGGPAVAHSTTVLPCPAVPFGSLSGLHLPSFSTNLVSTAALQDLMVTTTTPGGQRVLICTCARTGHHLATFTRRPGLGLYTYATEPLQTLGHPSLPRLRGMHSRLLVSGLPGSLPPLPPSPAPPSFPCVEGRQRAAPHSSSFPLTTAPLHTLHMDVLAQPAKGEVRDVLIPWIRAVRLQLGKRFGQDLPVLRLHSDRGGEFSLDLLRDCCRGEGITQSFTLPTSP
ncbi:unnamed protein product [Closterium sp. NIES-53]